MRQAPDRPQPLRAATVPRADESLRGVFARALAAHHVPHAWAILKLVGGEHRNRVNLAEDERIDVAELARVVRVPLEEIALRRYASIEARRRSFFGLGIREVRIENRLRRFSPISLSDDPYIRAAWELRDLPFCAVGWDLLADRCGRCATRQTWMRPNGVDRCDSCGRPLSSTSTGIVPSGLRDGLIFASDLASPLLERQQMALARLDPRIADPAARSAIFDVVMRLRREITTSEAPGADLVALHAACVAMLDWPAGLAGLRPVRRGATWRWPTIVRDYLNLAARREATRHRERPSKGVTPSTRNVPASSEAGAGAPRRDVASDAFLGMRPAYELARVSCSTIRAAMASQALPSVEIPRGRRLVPMFRRVDVVAFGEAWRRRLPRDVVGHRLGLGAAAMDSLVACDVLEAGGLRLNEEHAHFLEMDVAGLEDRLAATASLTAHASDLPLVAAVMMIHGRIKPWGTLMMALVDGTIPFRVRPGREGIVRRIVVARSCLGQIADIGRAEPSINETIPAHLQTTEALETLNCGTNASVLAHLRAAGGNPRRYRTADILELSKQGISTIEWALRREHDPIGAYHLLRLSGVPLITPGFFDRLSAALVR